MPFFEEERSPMLAPPKSAIALRWGKKMAELDGYIFVTAEYNHGLPAVLKNALDYAYAEYNRKPATFVGYGSAGATRAVEQLRLVMAELQVATVRNQVALSLFADFENYSTFKPHPRHEASVNAVLDQVIAWAGALQTLRQPVG